MIQVLVNGVVQGLLYALLGLAFSMVFATTRVFYLALGSLFTLAPYLLLAGASHGAPRILGLACAVAGTALTAVGFESLIHWPLERRRASEDVQFIGSLGSFLVVSQTIALIWGHEPQVLRAGADSVTEWARVRLTHGQIVQFAACGGGLAAVLAWFRGTETGLRFRALASNATLMSILGADVRILRLEIFGISGALVALGAIASAYDVGFDPDSGMRAGLVAVAATIVGGRTSVPGVIAAGLALGVLRSVVIWYTSARWEDAVTFAVLAFMLTVAPQGLGRLGRKSRAEALP